MTVVPSIFQLHIFDIRLMDTLLQLESVGNVAMEVDSENKKRKAEPSERDPMECDTKKHLIRLRAWKRCDWCGF